MCPPPPPPAQVLSVCSERSCISLSKGGLTASARGPRGQAGEVGAGEVGAGLVPGERAAGQKGGGVPQGPEAASAAEPCLSPDVDECHMFADLCPHGECINSLGSFRCRCQAGYTPDAAATACLGEPPRPRPLACPGPAPSAQHRAEPGSRASPVLPPATTSFGQLSSCYFVHPKIFSFLA